MFIIVAYDVPAQRTEKYRKLLSRYLQALQYSVFAGDMTQVQYRQLRGEIKLLYEETDHLIFVKTANRRNMDVEILKNGISCADTSHLGSTVV